MTKHIRVRSTRRREVDADRLAVAFLLLSKILHEQDQAAAARDEHDQCRASDDPAAAARRAS